MDRARWCPVSIFLNLTILLLFVVTPSLCFSSEQQVNRGLTPGMYEWSVYLFIAFIAFTIIWIIALKAQIARRKLTEEELNKHREQLERMIDEHTSKLKNEIIERKQTEDALYFVAQRGWALEGNVFLRSLVQYLSRTLEVDYAFVDEFKDGKAEIARTVVLYAMGEIQDNIEYSLRHTPCENVMGKRLCCYPQNVQQLFPLDELLVQMQAESYIGVPLWDSKGATIGLIAVMDRKPLKNTQMTESLLQIVAVRTAHELERIRSETELRKYHEHLEDLVEERTTTLQKEIIERKRAENNLKVSNEKLKELDQLKSMFIASMSHELRTPLNSIIGFTEIILDGLIGELNLKQTEHLSRVHRAANHLLAMISDIIDISRIESGRMEVSPDEFDLNGMLNEAVDSIQSRAEEKGLAIEVKVMHGMRMNTDRRRLFQCILNLLNNAMKFTEKGTVELRAQETDNEIEFAVSDTGIGIAEKDISRIFMPFERIESHLKVKAGGTGLGLYLTKKIVTKLLRGSIEVESEEGKGSTFRLRVPKEIKRLDSNKTKIGSKTK